MSTNQGTNENTTREDEFAFHTAELIDDDIRRAGALLAQTLSFVQHYIANTAGRGELITTLSSLRTINKVGEVSVMAAELAANLTKVIEAEHVVRYC
jgi:hypothetical protein